MSNTQFAFLKKENVPDKDAWQKEIDALNFQIRLEIDPDLNPFEDSGFLPCKWGETDEDVGFEIYYEPSSDIYEDDEELKVIVGDNDYCISMCWGGSLKDCAAVMIASCALAKGFGAVISYQGDESELIEDLIKATKEVIPEALKEE